ncbi:MAG TPA: TIGR01777 family oxidoreductase [Candidatus Acidoferrales bacterium]
MKVLVSGSSGLVGSALLPYLTTGGHAVTRLVRTSTGKNEAQWDPVGGTIDAAALEGHDAVVHLAGESIAQRWTPESKARIRDSRVKGTRLLAEALARLAQPPKVLVAASAVGYYGDRGDALLREDSASGSGFLAEVAREWEAATAPATAKGIRVVNLRIGVVLSPRGGALAKMLLPFKLGAGGVVGSGKQHWSWVALDDLLGIILFAATTDSLKGPVNAVSPTSVTNYEFTKTLGRVLRRPTIFPMPAFAARLVLGEMVDELLLSSAKVEPAKLTAAGYTFLFPELEGALRHLLRR